MSNYDLEEDFLLRVQICLSVIFIFTLIISISLTYNALLDDKIYSDEEATEVLRINRIISFLVAIGFLLINVKDRDIKERYNLGRKSADMQIMASFFTLISSFIVLYVAFNNSNEIVSNENPEI